MPDDPMSPQQEGFVAMHEIYTGLRKAGFTLFEAAAVLGAMIANSGASQNGPDGT